MGVVVIEMGIGKKEIGEEVERKILKGIEERGGEGGKWRGGKGRDIGVEWI